jgi:DNA repair protein RadC
MLETDQPKRWQHPGGKLLRMGAASLMDSELLAILVSSGTHGMSAEQIGEEIVRRFASFRGIAERPLEELMQIKGLKKVKAIRIAAALEIARRILMDVYPKDGSDGVDFRIHEPMEEYR